MTNEQLLIFSLLQKHGLLRWVNGNPVLDEGKIQIWKEARKQVDEALKEVEPEPEINFRPLPTF